MSENSLTPSAVVDTNLFVSGTIVPRGNPYRLRQRWLADDFALLLSEAHDAEREDVFNRPNNTERYNVPEESLAELFDGLSAATRAEPSPTIPFTARDPNDEKVLAAALGGHADYLVTGDRDLLADHGDPRLGPLQIVAAAEFLARLKPETDGSAVSRDIR